MSLLTSRALPLGAKGRLHFACVGSIMLYGSVGWAVEEEDVIRLERNDVMVRWMYNVEDKPEDRISAEELRTRLKLKSMREC